MQILGAALLFGTLHVPQLIFLKNEGGNPLLQCLQARENAFAGFLEDTFRGGIEERPHAGQSGEFI